MKRGGGSGAPVSLLTAIPRLFVKDINDVSAVIYWASGPNANRSGFRYRVKNLTTGVPSAEVVIVGSDMEFTLGTLVPENQYQVSVENLYGTGISLGNALPSTTTSIIFNTLPAI